MLKFMSLISSLLALLSCAKGGAWKDLDVDGFAAAADQKGAVALDVRTPEEYAAGHLAGAVNINWFADGFLAQVEAAFPKETPLAVYCRSGRRSAAAAERLTKAGYTCVCNLLGGYLAWTEAGKAVSRYETEIFLTPGGLPVEITLVKHGTLAIRYVGHWIQVDPVSGLSKPTDYAAEFPKADLILITHEHGDHLDPEALKALTGEKTRLLLNAASAAKLAGVEGVPAPEVMAGGDKRILVFEERPESSVQPGDVIVEAVPAYNTTPGREKFHPKGNGNGYVLTLDGLRIYIAGDTEDIPEMAELKDIDVAFLPCNQPYTMTPDQCVRAAEMIRPKVLIPYHFGETDITALPDRLPGMKVLLRQMQ